jgi:UDP-4-amino-4,6-dideoxy-N-acetyl-beta-L-altrosamine transaminase
MIPYGRQSIDSQDLQAVLAVLQSDWLTQGPAIERFEREVAAYCGTTHAVATCNATAALHLACLALGLGPGDRLWTTPNTFVASANCGRYCGAEIDFVDIDPATYNMSVETLTDKLRTAERHGQLPKVVVPVHFAGQACRMREIKELASRYGFKILEDASHAIGGRYRGQPIGAGEYADVTVFSFHPVKIITTGEGGMALTRDAELAGRMQRLRSHGITREANELSQADVGEWYYEQTALGLNYRLTDLQAALGCSQLQRLDRFVSRRRELAERYTDLLGELPLILPLQQAESASSWHLYVIQIDDQKTSKTRQAVFSQLRQAEIGVNVHYIPVHLQPYYKALGFGAGGCPQAEAYYSRCITLPLYAELSDAQQDTVVEQLQRALR